MKMTMKSTCTAAILTLALMAGPAMAETATTNVPQQQMNGNMMGKGMKGGNMQGNMMGKGMKGGNMQGNMMGNGMMGKGMQGGMMGGMQAGMGCNGMMGGMMMQQMAPEQQQEFLSQTTALRKQMMEKRFTYMEAMRNPETAPADLAAIEKEMLEIRGKMMDTMKGMQKKK